MGTQKSFYMSMLLHEYITKHDRDHTLELLATNRYLDVNNLCQEMDVPFIRALDDNLLDIAEGILYHPAFDPMVITGRCENTVVAETMDNIILLSGLSKFKKNIAKMIEMVLHMLWHEKFNQNLKCGLMNNTLLHYASDSKILTPIMKELLRMDKKYINEKNTLGYSPLDMAIEAGNKEGERLLRIYGAKD